MNAPSSQKQPETPGETVDPVAAEPAGNDRTAAFDQLREERRLERLALLDQREALRNAQLRDEVEEMEAETDRRRRIADAAASEAAAPAGFPAAPDPQAAMVPRARLRPRHVVVALSFLVLVVAPVVVAGWYLWTRAYDRYASTVGFSVRSEQFSSAFELLGGAMQLSGSSSSDTEILYQFIQSPELVRKVDAELDLRALWARADPAVDPVYAYHPPGTIEDMTDYWRRMVKVYSGEGSGLIDLEVQAFTPGDAQAIAKVIYRESSDMINTLSALSREDAIRYARTELDETVERLKAARAAMTQFRNDNQIVDPQASLQSQMGILSSLQAQLAQTMVELDLLKQSVVSDSDPRILQGQRRVDAIEARIAEERRKLGFGVGARGASDDSGDQAGDATGSDDPAAGGGAYAGLVGEYERLTVDLQFAEHAYTAALGAYDSAVAEARRQSRYLAAHVAPTLPERAIYPDRVSITVLVAIFAFLAWTMLVLIGYSLRDRR